MQNAAMRQYKVMALEGDGRLVINVLGEDMCFRRRAASIMQDPEMLQGFDETNTAYIECIAGMDDF